MDLVEKLREAAEVFAADRRAAEYGPGGGNPKAKAQDYVEWMAADEIERLQKDLTTAEERAAEDLEHITDLGTRLAEVERERDVAKDYAKILARGIDPQRNLGKENDSLSAALATAKEDNQRLKEALEKANVAVNTPCGDALDKLWKEVMLRRRPDYGDWEYPGFAYRHLKAEFEEIEAALATAERVEGDLLDISERLRTQDNRCTVEPMFCVQEKHREYGFDTQWNDDFVWIDVQSGDNDVSETEKPGYIKTGYKDTWLTVMVAFTEEGCKDYLRLNGHNLGETRIYVESFRRCDEMIRIRAWLMSNKALHPKSP